jgi:tRNA pseudouridine38-40 synthase
MGVNNFKMVLGYEGTRYKGWQRQKEDLTVQQVVEEALERILKEKVCVIGAGRTDAGVHALKQTAHFRSTRFLSPAILHKALLSLLPMDIQVCAVEVAPPEFHARFSAKEKVYGYYLWNRSAPPLFFRNFCWPVSRPLALAPIKECLDLLIGRHDFSAFQSVGSAARHGIREMKRTGVKEVIPGLYQLIFAADGFLRHMVRTLAGTLVQAGTGKITPAGFQEILASKDRSRAGVKAPARGLFLLEVVY